MVSIANIDFTKYNDKHTKKNHKLLPENCFRSVIAGGSGSGKTVMITNLILHYLNYDKLYIFAPSINQPAYLMLKETFKKLDDERQEMVEEYNRTHTKKRMRKPDPIAYFNEDFSNFNLDDLNKKEQNLIIIDDMILNKKQDPMINLYVRGRHNNCSVMYLVQSYYFIPKIIRQNTTCVFLFNPTTKRELSMLHRDIGQGVELKPFIKTIENALKERYSFIKIDTATKDPSLRYTKGFNEPLLFTN